MDIWLVSSLQSPGEGEEDAHLEFQGASGTYLPWCPTFLAVTGIVFPQKQRSGRLEDVISRVWLYCVGMGFCKMTQALSTIWKKVFFVVISWELAPDSPGLKCLIRLSATSGQLGNPPPLSRDESRGPARLHGISSSGFMAWHIPAQSQFMTLAHKDSCNLQKPTGKFFSLLMCNWAWCLSYIKPVWSVPWLKGNVYVCACACMHARTGVR